MSFKDYLRTIYVSYEDPVMHVQEFRRKTKIVLALPDNMGKRDVRYKIDQGHIIVYTVKEDAFGNSARNNYSGCIALSDNHVIKSIRKKFQEERRWFILEIPKDPHYTLRKIEEKEKRNKN